MTINHLESTWFRCLECANRYALNAVGNRMSLVDVVSRPCHTDLTFCRKLDSPPSAMDAHNDHSYHMQSTMVSTDGLTVSDGRRRLPTRRRREQEHPAKPAPTSEPPIPDFRAFDDSITRFL